MSAMTQCCLGLLLLLPQLAFAQLPKVVEQELTGQAVSLDAVSVYVRQVGANESLITHHADRAMNPASTMKLVTTYAALDLLGPAYRWRTEIYRDGELVDGVLHGNLIIKGYGNPELMQHDMWRMLSDLRQTGLREIRGSLILDDTYFSPEQLDAGQFDNEPYRAYNAIPNALTSNLNSTSFKFYSEGGRVIVQVSPPLPDIMLINQLQPLRGGCGDWRSRLQYEVQQQGAQAKVVFSGGFPISCDEKYLDLSLFGHASYTYQLFREIWQQLGGTLTNGFRQGALPLQAVRLSVHYSQPLADVIRRVNKYSNNLMTRQLLLTIAAERTGQPGTETNGAQAVKLWLASKGLTFPELVIDNGSGLSRIERISARHLGELLLHAYASPLMAELMSSLPLLAVDGTAMRRLNGKPVQGRAHIKTGSIDGVRALAGYVLDEQGRRWVVVFIANHPRAGSSGAAQDALLEWIYHMR
jgi:D-alanyl-D-alanine carboxypeptidase/D-alanyl-D-alanine-endopeptidase (penicillin-binding protein 4)